MRNASATVVAWMLAVAMGALAPSPALSVDDISWPEAIRGCWNDASPNTYFSCYYTEGKMRGRMSGKECLVEAIKSARENNKEGALRWILACQCGMGNAEVKQALRDHEDDAVRLVVDTYGSFVQ